MVGKALLRVLFADRELSATRSVRVALRRQGVSVMLAGSAAEVMELSRACVPDLLVLDDGILQERDSDFITGFKESFPETEIILLHSGFESIPHGSGLGLLFSARKPVSKGTLLEIITSAFPGRLSSNLVPRADAHTLLCVDDDRGYLHSLSRFLERRGYKVSSHDSAQRALEAVRELRPELAIVDIMMPGMDGLALSRRIREISEGHTPVIVLTALDSDETYHLAHESGAKYCLSKPCKPEDFLNVVDLIAGDLDDEERKLILSRPIENSSAGT